MAWAAIGLLAATLLGMLNYLGSRIEAVGARVEARINTLDARLTGRIDSLDARLSSRIDGLGARIDVHLQRHPEYPGSAPQ